MKKRWTYSLPVKAVAAVLCVLSVISAGLFTALAVGMDQVGMDEQEAQKVLEENIVDNYSAYVLEKIQYQISGGPDLDKTNFRYAVVQGKGNENLDDLDLKDPSIYLEGSPADAADYQYVYEGREGAFYNYYMDPTLTLDFWGRNSHYYYDGEAARDYKEITSFVYAYDDGIFYFRTKSGDYPAPFICIADQTPLKMDRDGDYMDEGDYEEIVEIDAGTAYGVNYTRYELVPAANGKKLLYINTNTGLPIDTAACEKWREVGFYDQNWNWYAGFDVRFVKEEQKLEISGTPSDDGVEGEERPDYYIEQTIAQTKEVTETAAAEPVETFTASDVYYTAPKSVTLRPISTNQLKPVEFGAEEYQICGKGTIWTSMPEEERAKYFVLSRVEDSENTGISDYFTQGARNVHLFYRFNNIAVAMEIISVILALLCLAVFCTGVGHRKDREDVVITWLDKVPFELVTLAVFVLEGLAIGACVLVGEEGRSLSLIVSVWAEMFISGGLLAMLYLATFLVRLKGHCFWKYTLIYWCFKPFTLLHRMMRENVPLFWKGLAIIGGSMIAEVVLMMLIGSGGGWQPMLCFVLLCMIVRLLAYLWLLMQMKRLEDGTRIVAQGDFTQKIATGHLLWDFKKHAEDINNIGENMDKAVHEQMKSEHLRTELITNVSHDIKTPLTSIINYVDLISKLDLTDPTLQEYVEVLTRQSARLKKLIEDLIEASKASTGNIKVEMETTDAAVLLQQAAGEFEQRLEARNLQLVIDCPEPPVEIMADGRHLWRVFDNLLSNICKYAMEGTRVYISLTQNDQGTDIIFRNISASQLNISSEELMERFVRGDSSRNTEGSGLGLSIAQSLMKLMHGEMRIHVDGDLFKVTLHFGDVVSGT